MVSEDHDRAASAAAAISTEDTSTVVTHATTATTSSSKSSKQQTKAKRKKNRKSSKSQHTLEHLQQRVSELYGVFETKGWFVPLPDSSNHKVWSNRNYGADKKRQRKHQERLLLESRIDQLETVLKEEHSWLECPPSSSVVIEEEDY